MIHQLAQIAWLQYIGNGGKSNYVIDDFIMKWGDAESPMQTDEEMESIGRMFAEMYKVPNG